MGVLRGLTAVLVALSMCSCASIFSGSSSSIEVDSIPKGASFSTNSGISGVTPASVSVPNGVVVNFKFDGVEGYDTLSFASKPQISGWVIGNVLLGGLIGLVVDIINPNTRVHRDVEVELVPISSEPTTNGEFAPGEVDHSDGGAGPESAQASQAQRPATRRMVGVSPSCPSRG